MITDALHYRNLGSPAAVADVYRQTYAATVDFIRSEYEDDYEDRRPTEPKITNRFWLPLPDSPTGVLSIW